MADFVYDDLVHSDREWFSHEGMATIRKRCDNHAAQLTDDHLESHFLSGRFWEMCLQAKPTYAERSAAWLEKQTVKTRTSVDPLRDALEKIANGHNDPRALAMAALKDSP